MEVVELDFYTILYYIQDIFQEVRKMNVKETRFLEEDTVYNSDNDTWIIKKKTSKWVVTIESSIAGKPE